MGIIAAQSIGEPGTQLTMRTFHTGGVAGLDITQGLPRVVELFEARKPKGMAEMAEVDGKVSIEETDKEIKLTITDAKGEELAYKLQPRARLLVKDGDRVEAERSSRRGRCTPPTCCGSAIGPRPSCTSSPRSSASTRRQGVDINDKHIELIVRQMMKRVRIDAKGRATLLPGSLEDRHKLKVLEQEGQGRGRHARPRARK